MTFIDFKKLLLDSELTIPKFTALIKVSEKNIQAYKKKKEVPNAIAAIAACFAKMNQENIDYKTLINEKKIFPTILNIANGKGDQVIKFLDILIEEDQIPKEIDTGNFSFIKSITVEFLKKLSPKSNKKYFFSIIKYRSHMGLSKPYNFSTSAMSSGANPFDPLYLDSVEVEELSLSKISD